MAATIRLHLTDDQRVELRVRSRNRQTAAATRERLEMVRLADAGWTVPHIARHLGRHEQTVRKYVKAFLTDGFAALPNRPVPWPAPSRHGRTRGGAGSHAGRQRADVDHTAAGRLAGDGAGGGRAPAPPQPSLASMWLWLEAHAPLTGPQAPRPRPPGGQTRRTGGP